jgi:malate dehydrogenase
MAQAGARFAGSLLKALKGEKGIVECTYVQSPIADKEEIAFFSTNVELGPEGVKTIHPIGKLSAFEQTLYDAAIPELKSNIMKGVEFIANA